jgi:glutamate carboxypeptidase
MSTQTVGKTAHERQILEWLVSQRGAMLALLETLVNTDSGSYDKAGVDAVGAHIRSFLASQGIDTEVTPDTKFGDAISATVGEEANRGSNRPILLMGHRDTVFPKGEPTRRPFKIEDGRAYGPGVADMKSGLVMNCFVLAAVKKFGGAPAPVTALFTGDEEIGSPFSRPVIERFAAPARAVFNSEPGRGAGIAVTGRKGGLFMRFEITGKAAHSGANFEAGISAISELAHKTLALHALSDAKNGITLNVGVVSGGQTVNTVAPWAKGEVDLRFITFDQRKATMEKVEAIMTRSFVPGTSTKLEITGEFLPMVETGDNKALFEHYAAGIRDLGVEPGSVFTGGCADSGFASATGAPTICGVGPVGGKAHSPEEFLEVETIVPRAQAVALAILRLK